MKNVIFMAALVLTAIFSATAQTNAPRQRSITVTGTAETEVVPDEIYVQVDLREYDKKGVGKINIDNIKRNFLQACHNIGLPDSAITVQGYQGYDGNYWITRKNNKKDPDLKASISYTVKLSAVKTIDALVDVLDDEATQNFFIAKVDYSKTPELKKQLKTSAIKAAKDKAIYLTEAIEEHIGGAISITDVDIENSADNNAYISQARLYAFANKAEGAPGGNNEGVGFRKIKFQFQVNVEFALK